MESPRKRHYIHHALRRNAQDFFHLGGVADQVVLGRVQHADAVGYQLHHVLVAGDDEDAISLAGRFVCQGADHVVRFETRQFEYRDAIRLKRAPDIGHLLRQVRRHGHAICLVAVVSDIHIGLRLAVELAQAGDLVRLHVAEGGRADVEDSGQILRRKVSSQLAQHVHKDVGRARRDARLGRHRPLPRHGMVGAKDKRHRVDQINTALGSGMFSRNSDDGSGSFGGTGRLGSAGDSGGFRGFLRRWQGMILPSGKRVERHPRGAELVKLKFPNAPLGRASVNWGEGFDQEYLPAAVPGYCCFVKCTSTRPSSISATVPW